MNLTCIICSDTIVPSSEIFTTQCGHLFHYMCLIQWIDRSKTCPQCRNKATEKTIHRVYFNLANTDHIIDDVGTLQNKIDNIQFQITLKEKDIKNYIDKYNKVKTQNMALREEVSDLENKVRIHDSVVHALKDQISFFKSKAKERDRLTEEIAKLKTKLKDVESVQLAINGTREEVNDMLRNENDMESLLILAATLKKALLDAEQKKLKLEYKFKQLQNDVTKYQKNIAFLELSNKELRKEFELSKTNWGQEKEYLTNIVIDMRQGNSNESISNLQRMFSESPLPLPQKTSKNSNDTSKLNTESPTVEEKVNNILGAESPYLPVKTSNAINFACIPNVKFTQISSGPKKVSIFKGSSKKLENVRLYKSDEAVYNGLGGQNKEDLFPVPKLMGIKRHKTNSSMSSSKFRKLTPVFHLNTNDKL